MVQITTRHVNSEIGIGAMCVIHNLFSLFLFNDTATTEIYTLSLHDALPISDISVGTYTLSVEESRHCIKALRLKTVDIIHLTDGRALQSGDN